MGTFVGMASNGDGASTLEGLANNAIVIGKGHVCGILGTAD